MRQVQTFLGEVGIRHPFIQAPMAGVSTPQLAAAVSNAGGMGSLGLGASSLVAMREALQQTQALTLKPVQINLFCHQPARRSPEVEAAWLDYLAPLFAEFGVSPPTQLDEIYRSFAQSRDAMDLLLAFRPKVVSFHFGLPASAWITELREAGIYTMAAATSVAEAQLIEQAGVDAIVAQGFEAGGHRGMFDPTQQDDALPLAQLLPRIVAQTQLPVIAAGGVMDGHDARAMLALGASAVQMGTAFVACPESSANAAYRAMLHSERAQDTRMTAVISGRPARGMLNRFIAYGEAAGAPPVPAYPVTYDAGKQLHAAAVKQGSAEFGAFWAGANASRVRALPAAALLATLVDELGDIGAVA